MADLREQLRRIEAAEPPELWAGIESRAREGRPQVDTNIASVVAFQGRRSEQRRRVASGLLAAAVFTLAVVVAWRAFRDGPVEPLPTASDVPVGAGLSYYDFDISSDAVRYGAFGPGTAPGSFVGPPLRTADNVVLTLARRCSCWSHLRSACGAAGGTSSRRRPCPSQAPGRRASAGR